MSAPQDNKDVPAPAAAPAAAKDGSALPLGPDGQPMTKSAAKKAAKEAERQAKKAATEALKAQRDQGKAAAGQGASKEGKKKKEAKPEEVWVDKTVPGEKKDLSDPMESGYNPDHVEASWDAWWRKRNFYAPRPVTEADPHDPARTFVIPLPPPNVTGALHIGHALTISIQDCLIRWHRMRGFRTLFVPGYDHAGIATQAVVEKRIAKLENKTRYDYGREAFLEKVFSWKDEYQARIRNQIIRLGASCDFTREAFTMDDKRSKAVTEIFCKLHEDGIIYRGTRLVNWCCKLNTTLSNLEVDQKQLPGRTLLNVPGYDVKERIEFGVIVSFAYPIVDSPTGEKIVVATTRPETMLGDSAIAVHPDDARYKHLHGKFVQHPFLPERKIPIVCDSIVVDMEFGTGAVKITPAHDPNDYEVGQRHNLEFINILNDDGTLNDNAGSFKGMKRFSARRAVIEALKEKDLYIETKDNPMSIPICSRSGDVVEPLIKPQWWVNCKPLASAAIKAVEEQNMVIVPDASRREFYHWMESIQDWCISRQLWWGHRVPAYFVNVEGKEQDRDDPAQWVVGRDLAEATERAKKIAGEAKFSLEQDEDVLDTWFSSGLWPLTTLGWPENGEDLKTFYPNSMLETGWDILFFWVARMVMLGVYITGKIPFKEVFCHAMVRDAHGRKMSKSLGNVIDPLDVISGTSLEALGAKLREGNLDEKEIAKAAQGQKKDFPKGIPQCGSDALRFALCAYTSAGRDINLDISRVEGYRKFCNKLWNATKFALMKLEGGFQPEATEASAQAPKSLVERWILHRLNEAAASTHDSLEKRNFMQATSSAFDFWLYELCDVYIEAIKPITDPSSSDEAARASAQETLYTCLETGFRLLHPFMPFVTEELWQRLPRRAEDKSETIALAKYPEHFAQRSKPEDAAAFEDVMAAVKGARGLASDYNLVKDIQIWIEAADAKTAELFSSQKAVISTLIKGCSTLEVVSQSSEVPAGCAISALPASRINVHALVRGKVDIDSELKKLQSKLQLNSQAMDKSLAVMNGPDWERAPENVRNQVKEKLDVIRTERAALEGAVATFEKLR